MKREIANRKKSKSHTMTVLKYLQENEFIDHFKALRLWGKTELAGRIKTLDQIGWKIHKRWIQVPNLKGVPTWVKEYKLGDFDPSHKVTTKEGLGKKYIGVIKASPEGFDMVLKNQLKGEDLDHLGLTPQAQNVLNVLTASLGDNLKVYKRGVNMVLSYLDPDVKNEESKKDGQIA